MPTSGGNGNKPYDFGRARTVAGLTLVCSVVVLEIIDSFRTDYAVDIVTLGLMLGTAGVLLGVEAIRKVVG